MSKQRLIVTGSWLDVIGLIMSAIGATRLIKDKAVLYQRLIVIGEGIQVVGDALQAIGAEDALRAQGKWIQSAGAGASSLGAALEIEGSEEEGVRLEVLGDSLQALGAAITGIAESDNRLLFLANKLEAIGATLEAIGMSTILKGYEKRGAKINALGSWIQAAGGTLVAIIVTKEFQEEQRLIGRRPQGNGRGRTENQSTGYKRSQRNRKSVKGKNVRRRPS